MDVLLHFFPIGGVTLTEFFAFVFLACEGPHNSYPCEVLLQYGGQSPLRLVGLLEKSFGFPEKKVGKGHQDGEESQGKKSQTSVQSQHQGEHPDQEEQSPPNLDDLPGKKEPKRLHVRGTTLHEISRIRLVIKSTGEPGEMSEEMVPQPANDPLRSLCGQDSSQE